MLNNMKVKRENHQDSEIEIIKSPITKDTYGIKNKITTKDLIREKEEIKRNRMIKKSITIRIKEVKISISGAIKKEITKVEVRKVIH